MRALWTGGCRLRGRCCAASILGNPVGSDTGLMTNLENEGSQPLAMASTKGTIKWFNTTKGYGFVTLENGGDAFCHASALAQIGATNVPPGSTVVCDLQESPRGLQVVAVHSIDTSTAEEQRARPTFRRRGPLWRRRPLRRRRPLWWWRPVWQRPIRGWRSLQRPVWRRRS